MKQFKLSRRIGALLLCALLLGTACLTSCAHDSTNPPENSRLPLDTLAPDALPTDTASPETEPAGDAQTEETQAVISADAKVSLPASSAMFSLPLAARLLEFCADNTAAATAKSMEAAGFTVLTQKNFDKADLDPSHTCAFTIGQGTVLQGNTARTALLVVIRGTHAGEWFSNFDFAPSHSDDALFAENFLYAAENVLTEVTAALKQIKDPLIIVCGHSRGAACANLLGVLLNTLRSPGDIYVYTYATPTTVRGVAAKPTYYNIFNLINPGDLVTMVPLEAWGYRRAGVDIILPGDTSLEMQLRAVLPALLAIAPNISSYYNIRHSLTHAGEGEDGLTVSEAMQLLCTFLLSADSNMSAENANPLAILSAVSAESDLYPFVALIEKVIEGGGSAGWKIAAQHFPSTYAHLIAAMEQK